MARTHQRGRGRGPGAGTSKRKGASRPVKLPASRRKQKPRKVGIWSRILRVLGVLIVCLFVGALAFAAGGYLGVVRGVEQLEAPQNFETHPTYIYSAPLGEKDSSRRVIGTIFGGQNRKTASLAEMPPHLLNALVAKEDERFMEHGGVDLWGIMRALWVDIRAGETVEGASTITQQYVKNAYLTHDQTWRRKIKEAFIAVEIERTNDDKDEILADYLNTVYFGNNAYGVESAALVGLLWAPSTLGEDREAARYQRDLVLDKMADAGYISRQDSIEALEDPIPRRWPVAPTVESGLTGPALTRDFAEMVEGELIGRYGVNTVLGGGLSVYTTLDLEAQVTAREILYAPDGYLPAEESPDAALVSLEPGIDPETEFVSEKKAYEVDVGTDKPERWKVKNYDGIERGTISLEEALWWSDNTVFTDLVMNADGNGLEGGPAAVVDVAKRLGIEADFGSRPHPSVVLGTQEVSPLDMAVAYATIANGGRLVEPTALSRVVSEEETGDKVLYEAPTQPEGRQVIDPEIANKATEIMIGDVTEGIAEDASLGKRPVAGKTGTSENFFDAWFIGYTAQLLTGIWMGYAEGGQTLEYDLEYARELNGLSGGVTPAQIWKTYMEQVLEGEPIEQFEGVEMPTQERTTPADAERQNVNSPTVTDTNFGAVPIVGPGAASDRRSGASPSSASPSSAAPSSARPSSVSTASAGPASASPSSAQPSSVSPSRRS